jgi:heme iron utilization protein
MEDEDLKTLYFATDQGKRKFENIKANNRIALLVENTTNSGTDINGAEVVTVIDRADIAGNGEKEILVQKYVNKHPYLEKFIKSTGCRLIKIKVRTYVFVENFQQSHTLKMD